MEQRLILINLLIKLGVAASAAAILGRSVEFKSLLFRDDRTLKQKIYIVLWMTIPMTLGVWARFSVPKSFAGGDLSLETAVLLGVIAGRFAGVTGGLLVALAAARGARVTATASSTSHARLQRLGAAHVVDHHDPEWADAAAATVGADGFDAAVNAVPGGSASAVHLVRDGGRLTTITQDPPAGERQITITDLYVRPDGSQLRALVELVDAGTLGIEPGPVFPAAAAPEALAAALSGTGGHPVTLAF